MAEAPVDTRLRITLRLLLCGAVTSACSIPGPAGRIAPAPSETTVLLARHGTSAFNPSAGRDRGLPPDPALASAGREEARQLAASLRGRRVSVIVTSPLRRARETAAIVAEVLGVAVEVDPDLAEFNAGDLLGEDWSRSPFRERFDSLLAHTTTRRPGGESADELRQRAVSAIDRIAARHRGRVVLTVAHGLTNRSIVGFARGEEQAQALVGALPPSTTFVTLEWPAGRGAAQGASPFAHIALAGVSLRAPRWHPSGTLLAAEAESAGTFSVRRFQRTAHGWRGDGVWPATRAPAWSPDGRHLLAARSHGDSTELLALTLATGQVQLLAMLPYRLLHPDWSPDGQHIAVTLQQADSYSLAIVEARTGAVRAAPILPGRDLWPRWHPAGDTLAFFSRRDTPGDDELYTIALSSASLQRLTARPGHDFAPSWSPGGDRLALARSVASDRVEVHVVTRTGRTLRRVGTEWFRATEPAWSPDGRWIAFAARGVRDSVFAIGVDRGR